MPNRIATAIGLWIGLSAAYVTYNPMVNDGPPSERVGSIWGEGKPWHPPMALNLIDPGKVFPPDRSTIIAPKPYLPQIPKGYRIVPDKRYQPKVDPPPTVVAPWVPAGRRFDI